MSFRRHLPRIVLAAAAVASIATSSIQWFIDRSEPLPQLDLDDREPTTMYAIQGILDTGEDEPRSRGGEVQVSIDLSARDATGAQPATVEVDLRSVARDSEIDHQVFTVAPGGRVSGRLTLLAWPECMARSCTEDFTLTVRRQPAQGGPTTEVSGTVYIDFSADGASEPPPGAGLILGVTSLGPVP
jgi:hypothetical protein